MKNFRKVTVWILCIFAGTTILDGSIMGEGMNRYNTVDEELNAGAESAFSPRHNHHHIAKRSVSSSTGPNITFILEKMGAFSTETQIKIGHRISFNVSMWVIEDGTTDLKFEILTESIKSNTTGESSAILSICQPSVTSVGSHISGVNISEMVGIMQSTANDGKYDRSVLDFGIITRTSSTGSDEADRIELMFDVVVNNHTAFTTGDAYWVSVGAQYNNKKSVWLGQAVFYGLAATLSSGLLPTFSLEGPSQLMKGTVGHWKINMILKDAANDVVVDVYAPVNMSQIMSICGISVGNTGDAFSCYGKSDAAILTFPEVSGTSTINGTHRMASLNLGTVINSMFWSTPAATSNDTTITIDVAAMLLNVSEAVVGENYWLAATVEIDKATIWSAQMGVVPTEFDQTQQDAQIPSLLLYSPHDDLPWGAATTIYINITIPTNSSNTYRVEFALPTSNETAILTTCDISVYYIGKNFPCWDYNSLVPVFESEVNASGSYDYTKMDLGYISNAGIGSAAEDSTIVIKLTAKVTQLPNNTEVDLQSGDSVAIIGGLQFGYKTIWVGQIDIKLWDNSTLQTDKQPKINAFSVMNSRDAAILYARGTASYGLKLDLPFSTFWPNMTVTVESTTIDGIPAFGICGLSILQVGRDIPEKCMTNSSSLGELLTEGEKIRVPKSKNYVTSSMTLSIPNLSNGGYGNFWWNANDSAIILAVSVQDADHGLLTNKEFYWFNVTVDYGGSDVLKEDVFVQYVNDTVPALSVNDNKQNYELKHYNASSNNVTSITTFGVAKYDVNILTTPRTIQSLRIEANSQSDLISVCRIAVRQKGSNFPCINPYINAYKTYYGAAENISCTNDPTSSKCVITQVDHGILDLGNLTNYGQFARNDTNQDDSLLSVEVALKFHPDLISAVNHGDVYKVATGVHAGSTQLWINDLTFSADTSSTYTNITTLPVMYFTKLNTFEDITKGSAAVYVLSMYMPPGSTAKYNVEFFVPSNSTLGNLGKTTICEGKAMSANWNLPCVNDTHFTHDRNSSDNETSYQNAIVGMDLVSNYAADDGTYQVESKENLLTLETVVSIPPNGPGSAKDNLWVAATVRINDDKIWASSIPIHINETLSPNEYENDTLDYIIEEENFDPVRPGGRKRFHVTLFTDMMTNKFTLNFLFPNDGTETYMTLQHLHYSHLGKNFPCSDKYPLNDTVDNSLSTKTSQDENVVVQLGLITNVGTSRRYQFADYSYLDDAIRISFDVVPSDHANVANMSVHGFDVQLTDAKGTTKSVSGNVTTMITGDERPWLQIAEYKLGDVDDARDYKERIPGTKVSVSIHFNHTWESSKHGYNVVLRMFVPEYLEYSTHGGFAYIVPAKAFNTQKRILSFTIPEMFFSDNETFHVNFTFDPTSKIHVGTGKVHFVLPMDITYEESASPVNFYKTSMSKVEFDAFVPDCNSTLGMEDGRIKDCQISYSVSGLSGYARLNSDFGWKSKPRSSPFQRNEYLQISFGNLTKVTVITLQVNVNDTNLVQTFALQYSYEGKKWFDYKEIGSSNLKIFNISTIYPNLENMEKIDIPITNGALEARYLRFIPKDSVNGSNHLAFRIEFNGCVLSTDVPLSGVCKTDTSVPVYERGYLLNQNNGNLYVCMVSNIDDYIKCSYTSDSGDTWNAIDDSVININFLQSSTNMLYGVARNKKSRMRSADGGENWCTVTEEEYSSVEADNTSNVIKVKHLPFESWPLDLDTLYSEFGWTFNASVKWTADTTGVHEWNSVSGSWKVVSYWFTDIWQDST